jgi:uncharacterized repeat protein (TIGR01451 family)
MWSATTAILIGSCFVSTTLAQEANLSDTPDNAPSTNIAKTIIKESVPTDSSTAFKPDIRLSAPIIERSEAPIIPTKEMIMAEKSRKSAFANSVSGTVFKDYNADGVQLNANAEPGVAGVTVTAYGSSNNLIATTTTSSSGTYSLSIPAGTAVRVEFTNLPAGTYTGPSGNGSGTTVQFVTADASNVNLGINNPVDYCQDNPGLATPRYTNGNSQANSGATTDARLGIGFLKFNYNDNTSNPNVATTISTAGQVGAVWGVAYHKFDKKLFTGAYTKRHVSYGPLGSGGIYLIDPNSAANATPYLNLQNFGFATGADPHSGLPTNKLLPSNDGATFDAVGKIALGDMDISDNGQFLYVMNLNQKKLIRIQVSNAPNSTIKPGSTITAADISSWDVPNPSCVGGSHRPFATKFYRDKVYVGVVCDAQSSQSAANLKSVVYEFNPNTGAFTQVFTMNDMTFNRGAACCGTDPVWAAKWRPWLTSFPITGYNIATFPQPVLSDIEFDADESMILGFMDRSGDQTGRENYIPNTTNLVNGINAGDIIRTTKSGTTWTVENNATASGRTTSGAGNAQGPGGGEYYVGDDSYDHQQAPQGGLALRLGSGQVVTSSNDPVTDGTIWAGGVKYLDNATGLFHHGQDLFVSTDVSTFGKANGLGDIELMCALAPIEVGNRVWMDSNNNGVQDGGEMGISGVTVNLYKNGTLVGMTTTNSKGEYYFNNTNVNKNGAAGILPNMAYEIRLDKTQTAFTGKQLAAKDATAAAGNDAIDSDATMVGNDAVITLTSGSYGQNNHTYDFGFGAPTIDLELDKTVSPANPTIGSNVTFRLTLVNKGPQTATNIKVADYFPTGLTFVSANTSQGFYTPGSVANTYIWQVGSLAANSTAYMDIVATVTSSTQTTNCAEVEWVDEQDIDSTPLNGSTTEDDDACVPITGVPKVDLEVTKVADTLTPVINGNVTFTITVSNKGPQNATGVEVKDLLPSNLQFVSATPSIGSYNNTTGIWTVGNLNANTSQTLRVVAKAIGAAKNCAEVSKQNESDVDSTPGNFNNGATNEDDDDCKDINPASKIDLSLTKVVNNSAPLQGSNVTFTVQVSNAGPSTATNVAVKDLLPAGLTFVSSNPATYNSTTGVWNVGTLAANANATLTITATATGTPQMATNCAEVSNATESDVDSTPNNGSTISEDDDACAKVTTSPLRIDLELNKTVNTSSPAIGGQVTYTISVVNKGPNPATGVIVNDVLPAGLTYITNSGGYNPANGQWTVGSLAVNETKTLNITAMVTGSPMNPNNCAEVGAADQMDSDSQPNNNSTTEDDDDCEPLTVQPKIDLELTKTVNNTTPNINDNVTFTISVINKGPSVATGVTVKDLLPAGLTYVSNVPSVGSYSNTTGIWTVGTLAVNEQRTLQIVAKVTTTSPVTNYAQVQSANETDVDSTPGDNSTTQDDDDQVTLSPTPKIDLELTKTVDNATPITNANVVFTLTVVNKGPSNATGVAVEDLLPAGLQYVSSNPAGVYNSATGAWTIGNLAVNATTQLQITAKVIGTGTIRNYAEIGSANEMDIDSTPGNNSSTEDDDDAVVLSPTPKIDLELTKTLNNATPIVGSNIIYTLNLINKGPSNATGVEVKDQLPAGLTFVSASTNTGSYNNVTGIWTVGNLAIGAATSLQITATVNTAATIINYAQVSNANEMDIDSTPNNNSTTEDDDDQVPFTSQARVDIELTKTVDVNKPVYGQNITFTITVVNKGPNNATGVSVVDALSNGLVYVSSNPSVGNYNNTTGLWTIGNLAVNDPKTLTITARVNTTNPIINYAEVFTTTQTDIDSTPGDHSNTQDDDDQVQISPDPLVDLELAKSVNNPTPTAGGQVVFNITVSNKGPQNATNVAVRDVLPTGLTFVSANSTAYNSGTGIWTVGTLNVNATQTLQITAIATGTPQTVDNCAEVSNVTEKDIDSSPSNYGAVHEDDDACAKVSTSPKRIDLSVTKVADSVTPAINGNVTFTITVANAGPDQATGVVVNDFLPAGLQYVSSSSATGGYTPSTGAWVVGTLNAGASANLTIVAKALSTSTNCAEVGKANEMDIDSTPGNNSTNEDDDECRPITVQPRVDIELVKSVDKTSVQINDNVTFTIRVVNRGPSNATGVSVKDLLPTGLQYVNSIPSSGSYSSTNGLWSIGNLALNQSETLQIVAKVLTTSPVTNYAQVQTTTETDIDSTPGNTSTTEDDDDQVTVQGLPLIDLELNKVVDKPAILTGDQVIFTIQVRNTSQYNATGVNVVDVLPSGFTFVSTNDPAFNPTTRQWNIGSLAAGASKSFQITVRNDFAGQFDNCAEVSSQDQTDTDSNPTNGVITEDDYGCANVTVKDRTTSLDITKSVDKTSAQVGDNLTYTLVVRNNGNATVPNFTVNDTTPVTALQAPVTYTMSGAATGSGNWTGSLVVTPVGGLAPNQTVTIMITGKVPASAQGTTIRNVATVTPPNQPPVTSNPVETVVKTASLVVNKTVDKASAQPGDVIEYTISVTNNGQASATLVKLSDPQAAAQLTSPTYTVSGGTPASGSWTGALDITPTGGLAPGQTMIIKIRGTVPVGTAAGTVIPNTAQVSSPQDPGGPKDSPTVTTVIGGAALNVVKSVNKATAQPGDELIYVITITNSGNATANTVKLDDAQAASNLTNPTYTVAGGTPASGSWTGTLNITPDGGLVAGESMTVTIKGIIPANTPVGTVIPNSAQVSSPQDPRPPTTSPPVQTVIGAADLVVAKDVDKTASQAGQELRYRITVTNNGPVTAKNVVLNDAVPLTGAKYAINADFTYATGGTAWPTNNTLSLPDLAQNQSVVVYVRGLIPAGTPSGAVVTNIAQVSSPQDPTGPNQSPPVTTVINAADLVINKTVDKTAASAGDALTYTLTITNNGNAPAKTILVDDGVATNLQGATYTATGGGVTPTGGSWPSTGRVTFTTAGLNQGQSFVVKITGTIPTTTQSGTVINNAAQVSSPEDPTAPTTSPTVSTIIGGADIALSKGVDKSTAKVGDVVTYTLTVRNNGTAKANTVTVSDGVFLTNTSYSINGGAFVSPWPTNLTLSTANNASMPLDPNEVMTIVIKGTVPAGTENTLIPNDAVASSPEDPTAPTHSNQVTTLILSDTPGLIMDKRVSNIAQNADGTYNVTFRIVTTNTGNVDLSNFQVTDNLINTFFNVAQPLSRDYGTITNGAVSFTGAGNVGLFNTAYNGKPTGSTSLLNPGAVLTKGSQATIDFTVNNVAPASSATYVNTATSEGTSPLGTRIFGTDNEPFGFSVPALSIDKKVVSGPTQQANGTNDVRYQVVIENTGSVRLTNIITTDRLVPDVFPNTFTVTVPSKPTIVGSTGSFNMGANTAYDGIANTALTLANPGSYLDPGARVTLEFTVNINANGSTNVGPFQNIANVSGQNGAQTVNASDPAEPIILAKDVADVAVMKMVDKTVANLGDQVTFTIVVKNNGPRPATGVTVSDALPAGLSLVRASTSVGTFTNGLWTVGSLAVGQSEVLTVVTNAAQAGSYTNTAMRMTSSPTDPNASNDKSSAMVCVGSGCGTSNQFADVGIRKSATPISPRVGDVVTYTLQIYNNGPADATNVVVNDVIPNGLTYTGSTSGSYNSTTKTWTSTLPFLGVGESKTVYIEARVDLQTTIENTGVISSLDQTDPVPANNQDKVTINPVGQYADISVEKSVDKPAVNLGENVTFTITVRNNGLNNATGVTVSDALPGSMTFISATPSGGTYSSTTGVWNIGSLAVGQTQTMKIVANATQNGTTTNIALVTGSSLPDPITSNNMSQATVCAGSACTSQVADVAITKSVSKISPQVGEVITYTLEIKNNGPFTATNVLVSDVIPAGLTYTGATDGTYDGNTRTWSKTIASLGVGEIKRIYIEAKVLQSGSILNSARIVRLDQTDPVSTNNESSVTINPATPEADIKVEKYVDKTVANIGDNITFTIVATNLGPQNATNIVISDPLPAGVTFINANATLGTYSNGQWTIPALAVGESRTLTIVANLSSSISGGTQVVNTARRVSSSPNDPNAANDEASVKVCAGTGCAASFADVGIRKSVSNASPNVGDKVSFTIEVYNNGPQDATNIRVSDIIPSGMTYLTATGGSLNSTAPARWENTISLLRVGERVYYTIDMRANQVTPIVNTARVDGLTQTDPISANNESSVTVNPISAADLSVTKTVNKLVTNIGDQVTFTVTVRNDGPNSTNNVTLQDLLPAGLSLGQVSTSKGAYSNGVWTVGSLSRNETATMSMAATVTTNGSFKNVAQVATSSQPDPDSTPGNSDPDEDDQSSVTICAGSGCGGTQYVDIAVTKSVDKSSVNVGDVMTYNVTVRNNGPAPATGVVVSDVMPSNFNASVLSQSKGTVSGAGTSRSWNIGNLSVGETAVLQIIGVATADGVFTNTARVTSVDQTDLLTYNNEASATACAGTGCGNVYADLQIQKKTDKVNPNVGDVVKFTLTASNNGPNNATGVSVTDVLPAGLQFVSSSNASYSPTTNDNVWDVGNLQAGQSVSLEIYAKVLQTQSTITNTANISGNQTDPVLSNNTGSASVNGVSLVDLTLDKIAMPANPAVGSEAMFVITVANVSTNTATGVKVTDLLPAGVTYLRHEASQGSYAPTPNGLWSVGTVGSGQTATLSVTVRVDSSQPITNIALVSGLDQTDPTPASAQAKLKPIQSVDIAVTKTVDRPSPKVGDTVTFTITARNTSGTNATGVKVNDLLPSGLALSSVNSTAGSYDPVTGVWNVGNLNANVTASLTVAATVTSSERIANIATLAAVDQTDSNASNNQGIAVIAPGVSADLMVTKVANKDALTIGETFTYTIKVRNLGPNTATNVNVNDLLPSNADVQYISSSPSGSYNANSNTVTWTIPTLAANAPELVYTITAKALAQGTKNNTVTVNTADQTDPSPNNNSAQATVGIDVPADRVDIAVTKVANNLEPRFGEVVNFTITATNNSTTTATGVVIDDVLPAGLIAQSSNDPTVSIVGNSVKWNVGTLNASQTKQMTLSVQVNTYAVATNIATLSKVNQADSNPANNTGYATLVPKVDPVAGVDLFMQKFVTSSTQPNKGDEVTFRLVVTNVGNTTANNVTVQDALPATGVTFVSANPASSFDINTRIWNAGTIKPGDSQIVDIKVKANDAGCYENVAKVLGSTPSDSNLLNNGAVAQICVGNPVIQANLDLTKTVSNATPRVNDEITFDVVLRNSGPAPATGIEVTDVMPSNVSFISATPDAGSYNPANNVWSLGQLAVNQSNRLTIRAKVINANADINFVAVTKLNEYDPTPAKALVLVTPSGGNRSADLQIAKVDQSDPVRAGDELVYTIALNNIGPDAAENVNLTETLPANVTFLSVDAYPPTGWSFNTANANTSRTFSASNSILPTGSYTGFVVRVRVNSGLADGTTLVNNVAVQSTTTDPRSDNNTDTATTTVNHPTDNTADMQIRKVDQTDPVKAGNTLTYTLSVTNAGGATAQNVVVNDVLPPNTTFQSVQVNPPSGWSISAPNVGGTGSVQLSNPSMVPGFATITLTVNVNSNVADGTLLYNGATVSSSTTDPNLDNNNANATTTVNKDQPTTTSDLQVNIIDLVDPINAGDKITYSVTVTNAGPTTANDVVLNQVLPPNTTFQMISGVPSNWLTTAPNIGQSGTIRLSASSFPVGSFTYTVMVNTNNNTPDNSIVNSVVNIGSSTTPDNNLDNNTDSEPTLILNHNATADLVITKTASGNNVTPGSPLSYTITVQNLGSDEAANVRITDILPSNLHYIRTLNVPSGWTLLTQPVVGQSGQIVLTAPTVAVGSYSFTVETTVDGNAPNPSVVVNVATVGSTTKDPNQNNNTAVVETQIGRPVTTADLSVTKLGPATTSPGRDITYTIVVANNSTNTTAQNVEVSDVLPANTSFVSISSSTIPSGWNINTPAVGQTGNIVLTSPTFAPGSFQFQVTARVSSNLTASTTLLNNVAVTSTTSDPLISNNTASASTVVEARIGTANLAITKTDDVDPVRPGAPINYTITVSNVGPDTAPNLKVTDTLPTGVVFRNVTGLPSNCSATTPNVGTNGTIIVTCPTAPTGTFQFNVGVDVNSNTAEGTLLVNTAIVTADSNDPDVTNNIANQTTQVGGSGADVSIVKSAFPSVVTPGNNVVYTLTVRNDGPATASNVVISDVLPTNTRFVSITNAPAGWTVVPPSVGTTGTVRLSTSNMPVGSFTFNIQVEVDGNTPNGDAFANSAYITSTTPDPNPLNNGSTVVVRTPNTSISTSDLQISKTDSPDPVDLNGVITYTVTVNNLGPDTARNVVINDVIPSNLGFQSISGLPSGWNINSLPAVGSSGNLTLNAATLPVGFFTFTVQAQANSNAVPGSVIFNAISIGSSSNDPNPNNNNNTVETYVKNPPSGSTDLTITIDDTTDPVAPGGVIVYQIKATNNGPNAAQNVNISNAIPANTTFVGLQSLPANWVVTSQPSVGGTGTIGLSNSFLPAGGMAVFNVLVRVNSNVADGTKITSTATINSSTTSETNLSNNSDTEETTVRTQQGADLSITKSASPTVLAGGTLAYTLTISNSGAGTAQNVTVTDVLPAQLTYTGNSGAPAGWTVNAPTIGQNGTITLTNSSFAPGSVTFTIYAKVADNTVNGTVIGNSVTINSNGTTDPNPNNNTSTTTTTVSGDTSADISVVKTASTQTVAGGSLMSYTITINNNGPNVAQNVAITDVLPTNATLVSFSPLGNGWVADQTVAGALTFRNASMSVGSVSTTIVVQVASGLPNGSAIINNVTASSTTPDPIPGNNGSTTVTIVNTSTPTSIANLSVFKQAFPNPVNANETVSFLLTVINYGPDAAQNAVVTDVLPSNVEFLSLSNVPAGWTQQVPAVGQTGQIRLTNTSFAAGSFTALIQGRVKAGSAGAVINGSTVSSNTYDPNPGDNTSVTVTTVNPSLTIANLSVTKAANAATVLAGGVIEYTINVTNSGPASAQNVVVNDAIPANTTFVSFATGASGWTFSLPAVGTRGIVSVQNSNFGVGTASFLVRVQTAQNLPIGTQIGNIASVVSNNPDPNPTDNITPPVTVTIGGSPNVDLSVRKTVDKYNPRAGDIVTYSISVTNNSATTANAVNVTDYLAQGLSFYRATPSQGTYNNSTGLWSVGTLAGGTSALLQIQVTVNANYSAVIANTATVNGSDPDPNPSNNTSTVYINPTGCSSGHDGGIESDGSAAIALADRLFSRKYQSAVAAEKGEVTSLNIFSHGELMLNKGDDIKPIGFDINWSNSALTSTGLGQVIPSVGPDNAQALDVTPTDLPSLTNAIDVVGVDYFANQNNVFKRMGSVLGLSTRSTEVYQHTKAVCDRFGGGKLNDMQTMNINGQPFVLIQTQTPDGSQDFAVSFVAYRRGNSYTIDSRHVLYDYQVPSGMDEIYNFQVWGNVPQYTETLVKGILERLQAQGGSISYLNTPANAPKKPEVWLKAARYEKGKLIMEVVNTVGATEITLSGLIRTSETQNSSSTATLRIPLPVGQEVKIETNLDLNGDGNIDPIFDGALKVTNNRTATADQIYVADGVWSYNAQAGLGTVNNFTTTAQPAYYQKPGFYTVDRSAALNGSVTDWVSMYRFLRPNGAPVDLSQYGLVTFKASGSGRVDLQLQKASINTWDHYQKTLNLTSTPQTFTIPFSDFAKASGAKGFTAEDVTTLAFYVRGSRTQATAFNINIENVRFSSPGVANENDGSIPSEIALNQNYPNPFNPSTTINFSLPQASEITLEVFNLLGKRVAVLDKGLKAAGQHQVLFDAKDLPSGTYIYRLMVGNKVISNKMTLLK